MSKTQKSKKLENFIYHYKTRIIIISIIALILLVMTLFTAFDSRFPDYTITMFGRVVINEPDMAEKYYSDLLKVKEVQLDSFAIGEFDDGNINKVGMLWLYQDLESGDANLYILQDEFAKFLSIEGAVVDLMPYLEKLNINSSDPNIVWWKDEYDNDIAAAYRFGSSNALSAFSKGAVPDCFAVPFRNEFDDNTIMIMKDLISN